MQLSFPANKQIELTFKVGIAGTSSAPQSVAVVLEKNFTALSFTAVPAGDGWKAVIDNPGKLFGEGEVKVSVNVVLNNRLFTPMKGVGTITANEEDIQVSASFGGVPAEEPIVAPEMSVGIPAATEVAIEEPLAAPEIEVAPVVEPKKKKSAMHDIHASLTTEDVKKIFKPITPTLKPTPKVEEKVTIAPIRMQLLKSIEPGTAPKLPKIVEAAPVAAPKQKESLFKIKKTKVIYK
jgi:hypothetical protein